MATRHASGRRGMRAPSLKGKVRTEGKRPAPQSSAAPGKSRAPYLGKASPTEALRERRDGPSTVSPENLARARHILSNCVGSLGHIQARATTVELALKGNNAERDFDVAQCVRRDICDALFVEVGKLISAGRLLGAKIRNPFDQ